MLAYVSSQLSQANPAMDYVLADWKPAGLLKPSFVRPKVAVVEPPLVVHRAGALTDRDVLEVNRRLRRAMALLETMLDDVLTGVDLTVQLPTNVQALAQKSMATVVSFAAAGEQGVDLDRLRESVSGQSKASR